MLILLQINSAFAYSHTLQKKLRLKVCFYNFPLEEISGCVPEIRIAKSKGPHQKIYFEAPKNRVVEGMCKLSECTDLQMVHRAKNTVIMFCTTPTFAEEKTL